MDKIEINGVQLYVQVDVLNPEAQWVVMSNSLVTDLSIWDEQVRILKTSYNILRYDQRGHGQSKISKEQFNFDMLADDLTQLLNHYQIENAIFIGLSMGVPTGLAAYRACGFQKMVLIDGQAQSAANAISIWQQRIEEACDSGMSGFANQTAKRWLTSSVKQNKLEIMIGHTSLEGFIAGATALKQYDYSQVLEQIACPVLLLAGEQDGKMPENMQKMSQKIANAIFKIVPNSGHIPCFEQPETVNQYLLEFLGSEV